jgi:hypothetical protein
MDTQELATITTLLDLEGYEVVEMTLDRSRKTRRLVVVPTDLAGLCPHCNQATIDRHACYDRQIMDLPLGGCKTELIVRGWRFECTACKKFFTPRPAVLADTAHATERLLERGIGQARRRVFGGGVLRPGSQDGRTLVLRVSQAAGEAAGGGPFADPPYWHRRAVFKKKTPAVLLCPDRSHQ